MKKINEANNFAALVKSAQNAKYAPISKSVCAAMLAGAMVLGGGVFVSTPAYADGYVDGTGNNIYYGYKTDASYSEARFHIEVDYYDTLQHAKDGKDEGKDPLGKFVRVHYLSNCNKDGGKADEWRFRPMWWFGVPAGLKEPQYIHFKRIEKLTDKGNTQVKPAGSSQYVDTDKNGYGVVSDRYYATAKEWNGISNFYLSDSNKINSEAWKKFVGVNGGQYDDTGKTKDKWTTYQQDSSGLKSIFVDWESAGQRFYDMTYVAEMTQDAWEKRDEHPLRFAAGVYRFAGNWHYAAGQKHNTPKIADHLKLVYPEVTPVKDPSNVSNDEQKTIKDKIATANKNTKNYSELVDKVEVSDKGVATITFKDKTTRTIPASLLVVKGETDSDKYKPTMPERTPVVNLKKLTPDEKTKVRQAIIDANGKENPNEFLKHVKQTNSQYEFKVKEDGSVEVTYKDDSKLTIPASELVYQGATIADWAPYVVPDTIEVDDLKKLKQDEINQIIKAFDEANKGITPYDESKEKNSNQAPVKVSDTGDVTITWKDGSTTTIEAWQYLKEKAKQTPEPPAPAEEKTFIVEEPDRQTNVNFDPFKMTQEDLTKNQQTLDGVKSMFTGEKGRDAKHPDKKVNIKSVEYSVDNGMGYITFKADGYKDAKYPMSMFFKQNPNSKVLPQTGTTTNSQDRKGYKYNLRKFAIKGPTPTTEEKNAAVKQFVGDNYDGTVNDCSNGTYYLNANLTPKSNTQSLKPSKSRNDGGISYIKADDSTIKFYGTSGNVLDTIENVYLTNQGGAQSDTTLADLKKQAKALLKQRRDTDKLSNNDLVRAWILDAENLNNDTIDNMNEVVLRELIRKLTDATKTEYKYNTNPVEIDNDPTSTAYKASDEDFQKAVKAFLKANYVDSGVVPLLDNYTFDGTSGRFNGIAWNPKDGTKNLEMRLDTMPAGIDSFSMNNDGKSVDFKCGNDILFTVPANKLYKKKVETPAPSSDALKKMKDDAKQQIDRNPNLTKEQKEKYKKEIGDATTVDKIKEILKTAAKQGKDNQNDPSKKQTITENKGGNTAKKDAEDKKQKEENQHNSQQLGDKKKKASEKIGNLGNLTPEEKDKLKKQINGDNTPQNPDGATTPDAVQNILDNAEAINAARGALKVGELPFLDHGTGKDEDKALNDILGSKSAKDSVLATLEEKIKAGSTATAEDIKTALDAAKRKNEINEANAKAAANAKLDALLQKLTDAENGLNAEQKEAVKQKVEAAKTAITNAQGTVNGAKKPSEIKTALDGVNIDDALKDINTQVTNAQKTSASDPSQTQNGQLDEEKKAQKKRIQDSDLPDAEKQKAIKDINDATKSGDPTAIANRALKAKKIADALDKLDKEFKHLNNAQRDAFKAILKDTDASDHTNPDGTTSDDIDDALANATATDTAMARLEKLKKTADDFSNGDTYKNFADQTKKDAFDAAYKAAKDVLAKETGDAKTADQVNALYNDLLKAMQAIDDTVKGAGVNTDALQAEVDNDSKLKPTQADPQDPSKTATPGDPLYTTASKEKKEAFDKALSDAEAALKKAKEDNADQAKPVTTPRTPEAEAQAQQAVDTALQNLENARKALDGVDTKPLQTEIGKENDVKSNVKYTNADTDKKQAYDDALAAAKKLIAQLTGKDTQQAQPGAQQPDISTKEAKQKALDEALKALQKAYNELNGVAPTPTPAPTPAAVDKTDLAAEIALDSTIGRRMSYIVSPSDKQLAYDRALSKARAVYADPSATQDDVNAAAAALHAAARALSGYGSVDNDVNPLPTPSPVPGGAGFGVNDNAPTTVDKGELNVQIDSAEADSQPGNAGNNNAGNSANANANAADANNNAANGANSAAVNAAVENSPAVKQADAQVAKAQAALDSALAEAKKVAADPNATQVQVDAAAQKLSAARKALAAAKAHAAEVRASVRAQVLKSGVSQLSKTGSNVSVIGLLATVAAAGAAFFVAKRRGISRHSNN